MPYKGSIKNIDNIVSSSSVPLKKNVYIPVAPSNRCKKRSYSSRGYEKKGVASSNCNFAELSASLMKASSLGDLEIVEYLVKNGTDIHASDDYCVVIASKNGHLDVVEYLITNGADIFTTNHSIIGACENGHLDIVKCLIKHGVRVTGDNGESCTREAISEGHLDVYKYLVESGADAMSDVDICLLASSCGHLNILKHIFADTSTPARQFVNMCAHYAFDVEVVEYLIKIGANIHSIRPDHKKVILKIYGSKILKFWRNQINSRKILRIRNTLTPIYYSPDMKGGFFAKKSLETTINETRRVLL